MNRACAIAGTALAISLSMIAAACNRQGGEARQQVPAGAAPPQTVQQIPLVPGTPPPPRQVSSPFEGDAHSRAEGKRLYTWMNCAGCHFEGGGGIGPALMDTDWIYGGEPHQIFDSIASGRANGMPAYGDKLPTDQIWLIVEHVRSLGETAGDAQEKTEKGAKPGAQ